MELEACAALDPLDVPAADEDDDEDITTDGSITLGSSQGKSAANPALVHREPRSIATKPSGPLIALPQH
jgi:hypothetical protein